MAGNPDLAFAQSFASRVFAVSGIYGLAVMLPQYFLEERIGRDHPPAINHPEYFYGFLGMVSAWQVAFLFIARDPRRLRPLMLAAVIEKIAFPIPVFILYAKKRLDFTTVPFAVLDLILGGLFATSYLLIEKAEKAQEDRKR